MERPGPRRAALRALPVALSRVPFGVVRPVDAGDLYANPRAELRRLATAGALTRVATGYYAVVPPAARGGSWRPTLEAAAYGIAAADHGAEDVVLMGLSAARLHGAVPRALAVAVVAVPKQRPPVRLLDRDATVLFVRRDTARLDTERVGTDLGSALLTTPEQTLLDLARRPDLGGVPEEAWAAVRGLWPRTEEAELVRLAGEQRLRAALQRAREAAGGRAEP